MCTCIEGVGIFLDSSFTFFRGSISCWVWSSLIWPALVQLSYLSFPSAGMIGSGCHAYIFMWVLGIWTLVFMLIKQALYPLNHLPNPSDVCFSFSSPRAYGTWLYLVLENFLTTNSKYWFLFSVLLGHCLYVKIFFPQRFEFFLQSSIYF